MNRKYLLGAALVALMAGSSAAQAADVLPVISPMAPMPPVAMADPLTVDLEAGLGFYRGPSSYSLWAYLDGEIGYETPAGWGMLLELDGNTGLAGNGAGFFDAESELDIYKSFGALSLGLVFGAAGANYLDPAFWYGVTAGYETDTIEANVELTAEYVNAVYVGIELEGDATFDIGDRLVVGLAGGLFFAGGIDDYAAAAAAVFDITDNLALHGEIVVNDGMVDADVDFGAALQLDLGTFSPYVGVAFNEGTVLTAGVEFEHQLGTGPFALVGNAEAIFYPGAGVTEIVGNIGVRFTRGDVDDDSPFGLVQFGS